MIYIIQCLCPNRHAIYAIAYDGDQTPPKEANLGTHEFYLAAFQARIEQWIEEKTINPWCGICHSQNWTYEQRRTKYNTMEEALPDLERLEAEQIQTRILIDEQKAAKN